MKRMLTYHPLILCIFPIISLYAHNINETPFYMLLLPTAMSLGCTVIAWGAFYIVTKSMTKSGILTSIALFLFYSYGHISDLIVINSLPFHLERHRYMLSVYLMIFALSLYLVRKAKTDLRNTTRILNYSAIFLMLFPLMQIMIYNSRLIAVQKSIVTSAKTQEPRPKGPPPDIYYFIADGYAGKRTLKELFHFDNAPFIRELEKRGFFVAERSMANYPMTRLSLTSSLNMDYIDPKILNEPKDTMMIKLHAMLMNNRVAEQLRSLGYRFINFPSGANMTNLNINADKNINPLGTINEFTTILSLSTMLRVFHKLGHHVLDMKYKRVLKTFDILKDMPQEQGPKFVFVHMMSPHSPCVFGPKGEFNPEFSLNYLIACETEKAYTDEIIFLNKKYLELIDIIIAKSTVPPVIIIQADHGTQFTIGKVLGKNPQVWNKPTKALMLERTDILNAIYISPKCQKQLYEDITPINTFRAVFNCYLETDNELLHDDIYWCDQYDLKNLTKINNILERD